MKYTNLAGTTIALAATGTILAACGGSPSNAVPAAMSGAAQPAALHAAAPASALAPAIGAHATIAFNPPALTVLGAGSISTTTVTVSESGYTGTFAPSGCPNVVSISPASGKKFTVTGLVAGSCSLTFTDSKKNSGKLPVSVTTQSFKLTTVSVPAGAQSMTITLTSVNGGPPPSNIVKTLTTSPLSCKTGCTVPGPQAPAGDDAFTLTIYDGTGGKGNQLAVGPSSGVVVAGKANVATPTLPKVPKFVVFGTVPAATAGTKYVSPQSLPVTVQDADHNPISGDFTTTVGIFDNDTTNITQGSSLSVNGAADTRQALLAKSTDTLKIDYKGLAMLPASISVNSGATGTAVQFAPSLPAIANTAPAGQLATHEIDLYNAANGQPGFSAQFTATQAGWKDATFANTFTYSAGGANNNCGSFSISPGSGTSNQYTVQVAGSPSTGQCTLTVTGGASLTSTVLLTYTSSGIGINARKKHKP